MEIGFLEIHVYADNVAQPVDNAELLIRGDNLNLTLNTDSEGWSGVIEVPCPDREYSLTPQYSVRPYALCDITAVKSGLVTREVHDVQVLAGETSVLNIFMRSSQGIEEPEEIDIPDHVLWGNYPPKIAVDPDSQIPPPMPGDVLPFPLVPEFVLVHDGLPTNNSAPNYYELFIDYIKNVTSSEIYSTWPVETIKANVYAILSFTMNRIYSEWYRSQGYAFTITSSTQFDQKYIHGRNIFQSISEVVDEIFTEYIQRGNRAYPFFSQYNDGIRVNNPGWLSQWGSQDLGNRGYTALQILRYYYGDDVFLVTSSEIEGMPFSFPGYNLTSGICGDPVQKLQAELNVIASSYPAIPKINPIDGVYGQSTIASVEVFQRVFGIPVTGIVNFSTWYRISLIYTAVSKMLQGRYTV